VWPSLALGGFLATGLLSIALLRKPPAPVLLPTAPPEVEARAYKAPPTTKVPSESAEEAAAPTPSAAPKSPTPAKPAKTTPRKPAHAKKHARGGSTPRAG
jgi:hypothetical protein